jgi:hypothetical protein
MPKTHDYTRSAWGHNVVIVAVKDGGMKLNVCGWGHGVCEGDFLLLPNKAISTRYVVEHVEYFSDPSDMWAADLAFAPRSLTPERER